MLKMKFITLPLLALLAAGCGSTPKAAGIPAAQGAVVPAAARLPLTCHARASRKRPYDHTTVGIRVRTAAHARIDSYAALASLNGENTTGRANASGKRTLRFRVSPFSVGFHVIVDVHVFRQGRKGACQASFRPRSRPARAPAPAQPTATASPPAPSSPPSPAALSCYPLSNEGTCYEPGEYCRTSDAGMTGIAGDGEKIICENNNGLRWEPA